jgi:sodium/proline symporter
VWKQFAWLGLYELVPGFFFACVAIVIGSKFGAPASEKMKAGFAQMKAQLQYISVGWFC